MDLKDFAEFAGSTYGTKEEYRSLQQQQKLEKALGRRSPDEDPAWRTTMLQSGRLIPDAWDMFEMRLKAERELWDIILRNH